MEAIGTISTERATRNFNADIDTCEVDAASQQHRPSAQVQRSANSAAPDEQLKKDPKLTDGGTS
ncbi:hypothetical protein H257_10390 [Aphanomyces astaci]|uniref:Uncharacterized protein n=1 Tax=Aphanomyces astaci TaxID=112090 RepID=W4G683_APHAT|nr:hypothetical protein H257_10390 [Aphanomyces astaci]ETV75175.1 hypothetical protein H257_10390 [Aphanomyces astaci]|eukprot:XP_009835223.1 hypothetical protein H257_10390 [Aphanomyces astaci]